jgi:hypothetical protein
MTTSFRASTPSGPPALSTSCFRNRARRSSTSTYVGLYSLRKMWMLASEGPSESENCRNVTFVQRVLLVPSCPVEIKGRSSP